MNFLIIFILVFVSIFLSSVKSGDKTNKIRYKPVTLFYLIVMSLLIAARDIKVPDTDNYIEWYVYQTDFFNVSPYPFEAGYVIFMHIIQLVVGYDYRLFFFIIPLLNFFLMSKAFRIFLFQYNKTERLIYQGRNMSNNIRFGCPTEKLLLYFCLAYFCYFGLYYNAIVLRAGIAISLVMLSLMYAMAYNKNKLWIPSILFMTLSIMFHSSAAVCLPMLIMAFKKKGFSFNVQKILLISIFFIYLLSPYLDIIMSPINTVFVIMGNNDSGYVSKFDYYNDSSLYNSAGISFKFLFFYIFAVAFFLKRSINVVWNKVLDIYILGLLVWAIFRPVMMIERITDFYILIFVFLLPMFVYGLKSVINRMVILLFVCMIQLVFIYRIISSYL